MPVIRWNKQKCILGRRLRKSILKKYKAMPEAKEHNNIIPQNARKIKEEEIAATFTLPLCVCHLPKYFLVSGFIQKIKRGMVIGKQQQLVIPKQINTKSYTHAPGPGLRNSAIK